MTRPPDDRPFHRLRTDAAFHALRRRAAIVGELVRKYSPDQPRVPAGNSDGGQWTDGGVGSGSTPFGPSERPTTVDHPTGDPAVRSRTTIHADGLRIVSRVAGGGALRGGEERHTLIAQSGATATFETIGRTQTVYGAEGKPVLRNEWTSKGPIPVPLPRPVVELTIQESLGILDLAFRLQRQLLLREAEPAGTPVLAFRSRLFKAGASETDVNTLELSFIAELEEEDVFKACPKLPIVKQFWDEANAELGPRPNDMPAATFGTKVHKRWSDYIFRLNDPKLVTEKALFRGVYSDQIVRGSKIVDVLEETADGTICIYDGKTGEAKFRYRQASDYAQAAWKRFDGVRKFILIELRPAS